MGMKVCSVKAMWRVHIPCPTRATVVLIQFVMQGDAHGITRRHFYTRCDKGSVWVYIGPDIAAQRHRVIGPVFWVGGVEKFAGGFFDGQVKLFFGSDLWARSRCLQGHHF